MARAEHLISKNVFIINIAEKLHVLFELCSHIEACAVNHEKKRSKTRSLRDTMSDGTVKNTFHNRAEKLSFNEVGGKSGELYQ